MWGRSLAASATLGVALAGCGLPAGAPVFVQQERIAKPDPQTPTLRAAARAVDITPPPGLPMYGYGSVGEAAAIGYWLRLEGRLLALEDEGGQRLLMVQLDLGASSALLHRRLAAALGKEGIAPDNLVMATTHTHAGPGGFFGHRFYNGLVAGRPAYEPRLVDWLVEQLASGARDAFAHLQPAALAVGVAEVAAGAVHNRSFEAWAHNFDDPGEPRPKESVNRRLTLIRVDAEPSEGAPYVPIAAWSIFAVHGTSQDRKNTLHHGDVHGAAARLIRRRLERRYGVAELVAPTANGAEGDVSPGPACDGCEKQGIDVTMEVAAQVADAAVRAFTDLDGVVATQTARHPLIRRGYREISLRGAGTTRGRLCQVASLGAPQLAGSEAARGPLYGFLDMVEGAQRSPSGCDATKIRILGSAQYKIVEDDQYPDDVPFQVVTLGDQLLLAAVPGEPTTELGLEIERHVQAKAKGIAHYAVLGLTNGYSTYWTLPGEFLAQHYEGGATLYGPYQGILAIDQLERLAGELGQPWAIDYRPYRVFSPGEPTHFFPGTRNCDEEDWEAGDTIVHAESVDFSWDGIPDDQHCPYPEVRVECGGNLLHDPQGYPQSDRWFPFQIWREGKHRWTARWSQHAATTADCRIVVRGATKVLQSELLPTREP